MSLIDNYRCEGQMSIFDVYGQDIWSGKMYPEPFQVTKEQISKRCSKKPQKLSVKMPLFLNLRGGQSGLLPAASWEMGGALLGEYTMHSFGECPKEEKESRLSQILEDRPHPKYSLSARACQGILNRAKKRDKALPTQLEEALIRQSAFKNVPENPGGGKGILIQHERTGALSTLNNQYVHRGGQLHDALSPSTEVSKTLNCMEDPMKIITVSQDAYDKFSENDKAASIKACGGTYGGAAKH